MSWAMLSVGSVRLEMNPLSTVGHVQASVYIVGEPWEQGTFLTPASCLRSVHWRHIRQRLSMAEMAAWPNRVSSYHRISAESMILSPIKATEHPRRRMSFLFLVSCSKDRSLLGSNN